MDPSTVLLERPRRARETPRGFQLVEKPLGLGLGDGEPCSVGLDARNLRGESWRDSFLADLFEFAARGLGYERHRSGGADRRE
jgi:hypothetical protein